MLRIHRKVNRDLALRKRFLDKECEFLLLKSVVHNRYVNNGDKLGVQKAFSRNGGLTVRIRNRCVLTGRSRGIVRYFKMSRMCFKLLGNSGRLIGVKRSSW